MNPYPSYKDSRVEWIGMIPSDWKRTKIKFHFNLVGGFPFDSKLITNEVTEYPIVRIGNVTSGKIDVFYEGELIDKIPVVENGDYVVSLTGDFSIREWNNRKSLLNQRCGLFKSKKNSSIRYLYYLLPFHFKVLEKTKYFTTLKNLSNDEVLNLPLLNPPSSTQIQIVSFLDSKTQKIDELIEKTEQKIKLLKEGISSFLFYEKEGIDYFERDKYWFQIKPKSWEIVKFRDVFQDIVDKNHPQERLLSVHQKKGVIFRDEQEQSVMNPSGEISNYKLVQSGDFVISLRSSEGGFEYSEVKGLVSPVYTVLRPKFKIDSILFKYLFKSENFIEEINRYVTGIREGKTINYKDIRDIPIPITFTPNEKIIRRHDRVLELFEVWKERNELLREYRQSLISEVVTGKVDVRDWNK